MIYFKYIFCSGQYCPLATITPVDCPQGTYGAVTGLSNQSCSGQCSAGMKKSIDLSSCLLLNVSSGVLQVIFVKINLLSAIKRLVRVDRFVPLDLPLRPFVLQATLVQISICRWPHAAECVRRVIIVYRVPRRPLPILVLAGKFKFGCFINNKGTLFLIVQLKFAASLVM